MSYTLGVDVQASVTLPLNTVLVSKSLSKDVITTKGRTFNCTVTNEPKRYPVSANYIGGRSGHSLSTDACISGLFGIMWDTPYPVGANQGTSMSLNISVASIGAGPNAGWFFVKNMDNVRFEVDTNTNISFTTGTTTSWHAQHTTEAATLHAETQAHEERHVTGNVNSAEQDMPTKACNIPNDMYDQCEGVCSSTSAQAVKDSCATILQNGINYIRFIRWPYYEGMNQNDCRTCCDYFRCFNTSVRLKVQ